MYARHLQQLTFGLGAALCLALASGSALADTPSFTIVSPTDGAAVTSPVSIVVDVQGGKIGKPTDGLDHLHVGVDGGQKRSIYVPGPVELELAPGAHTVQVELAGPNHRAYGPEKSISITVK